LRVRSMFANAIFDDGEDRRDHVVWDILRSESSAEQSSRSSRKQGTGGRVDAAGAAVDAAAAGGVGRGGAATINATRLTLEAVKNIALLAAGQRFVGSEDSGFSSVAAALGCVAGHLTQEPQKFDHWREDQDPLDPPVSPMGTGYYVGPGLRLGARPADNRNNFNVSDWGPHALLLPARG
jgi:hypothetical protein